MKKLASIIRSRWFLIGTVGIFAVTVVSSYWGVMKFGYVVPPGDDIIPHWHIIQYLMAKPTIWPFDSYPPGLHYLVIGLTYLSGKEALIVMAYLWPGLLVLSSLSVYWLATKAFSKKVGLIAFALYALAASPLQTATDGGLPNVLATGVIMPISLLCWIGIWSEKNKLAYSVGFIISSILIILTHHLSTLVWLSVIAVSGVILASIRVFRAKVSQRVWLIVLVVASLAAIYGLFERLEVFHQARSLLLVSLRPAESPNWQAIDYSRSFSGVVFQFGLLGLIAIVWSRFRPNLTAKIVIGTWLLVYFTGSRQTWLIEPGRLARDMALPASILAGLAIIDFYRFLKGYKLLRITLVIAILLSVLPFMRQRINHLASYEPMIRFSSADKMLLDQIRTSPNKFVLAPKVGFWDIEARKEVANGQVRLIKPEEVKTYLKLSQLECLAVSLYPTNSWPESLSDDTDYQLAVGAGLIPKLTLADPNKIWYVFCTQ